MSEPLLVERRGDVLELTLHRPEALNAFTVAMHRALAERYIAWFRRRCW